MQLIYDPNALGHVRPRTMDEVRKTFDTEEADLQRELETTQGQMTDRRKAQLDADSRLKNAEDNQRAGQDRVRDAAQRREGLRRQLYEAQSAAGNTRRQSEQLIPAQSAADRATVAAEKAKEEREKREKDERIKEQERQKNDRVFEEEDRKQRVLEFRGNFPTATDPAPTLERLLNQQEQMLASFNEVLESHAGKLDILEQRIAENQV